MAKTARKKPTDFLEEYSGQGFEGVSQEDLKIPFLRILQKLSPEVDRDDEAYIKGASPGMFFNTVTKKVYSKEIDLIPVRFQKVWLEWEPDRGGLVARHEPFSIEVDKSDFSKWRYNGNEIQECYLFFVLVADHIDDGPMIFSLASTGIKHAKNWLTNITHTRLPNGKQAPFFSSVWNLKTVLCKNDAGSWYQVGDKTTAIQKIRFITATEFNKYVFPSKEALKTLDNVDLKQLEDHSTNKVDPVDAPF
jgi:hypothetical protein